MTPAELRVRRETLGLTQAQWAAWLDVGAVYVSQIERGARRPSGPLVRLVRVYMNMTVDERLAMSERLGLPPAPFDTGHAERIAGDVAAFRRRFARAYDRAYAAVRHGEV